MFKTHKIFLSVLLICIFGLTVRAQQHSINIKPLPSLSLDTMAFGGIEKAFDVEVSNDINVVGVGATSFLISEGIKVNNKVIQYLVVKKGFKVIALPRDNWGLEKLNSYLINKKPSDDAYTLTITKETFNQSAFYSVEFFNLVKWVKNYNFDHPDAPVRFKGTLFMPTVPPSYLIAKYIVSIDSLSAIKISKESAQNQSDAATCLAVINWFKQENDLIKRKLTALDYEGLKTEIENLEHNLAFIKITEVPKKADFVDSCMLQAIKRLVTKDGKIIIYGDNKMISKYNFSNSVTKKGLGVLLNEAFGKSYFAVVTDHYDKANFYQVNPKTNKLEKMEGLPCKDCIAYILHKKFNATTGVVLYDELKSLSVPIYLNMYDLFSNNTKLLPNIEAPFNLLVILKDLNAVKFLSDAKVR